MPYVLAHPAACLPIHAVLRGRLDLAALICGSIAPDLPWFVDLGVTRAQTHSLAGWLWFCLPVGLLFLLIWRGVLRRWSACLAVSRRDGSAAPNGVASSESRISTATAADHAATERSSSSGGGLQRGAVAALAVLVGAGSHLLWDAFTHQGTFLTQHWSWTRTEIARYGDYVLVPTKFLQHASSLGGIAVLALAGARGGRWTRAGRRTLIVALSAAALVCLVLVRLDRPGGHPVEQLAEVARRMAGPGLLTALAVWIVLSAWFSWSARSS